MNMAIETFRQESHCVPIVQDGRRVGSITLGGAMLWIDVRGKRVLFEMHNYHGPIPCNQLTHEMLYRTPTGFWDAVERWQLSGKLVDGDVCILPEWCRACRGEGIEKTHVGSRHYMNDGDCKKCKGKRIEPFEPSAA